MAELYSGVREGQKRHSLDASLGVFEVLGLERQAAVQAGLWRRQYGPAHGSGLADALIAAVRIEVAWEPMARPIGPLLQQRRFAEALPLQPACRWM